MEKEEEVDRRRWGKKKSKTGQGWTLRAHLGQLKTGQDGKSCCEVILGTPTTIQGYGTD